jgi:hypothetical protein
VLEGRGLAVRDYREKIDDEVGAWISAGELNGAHRQSRDPELLQELPAYGIEVALIGFDLAAWELPQAGMPLVSGPPAKQQPTVPLDDARYDANWH